MDKSSQKIVNICSNIIVLAATSIGVAAAVKLIMFILNL